MANMTPSAPDSSTTAPHPPLTKTISASSNASHKRAKSFRQETAKEFQARERHPLAGHFAHLTADQEHAFVEFRRDLTEKGLYTPAAEKSAPSHDDTTLLRFLRARKFDVPSAVIQFSDTETWRQDTKIETLYDTIDIEEYEQARSVYPQWTGRRDRRGIPLYLFKVGHLNDKTMHAYAKHTSGKNSTAQVTGNSKTPDRMLRLFALYESMTHFILPMCSVLPRENPETPVDSTNNIVDINGVGLRTFWNLKNHMQDASTLATAHYPETLDRIFIIGAPSFFPTVWGWIKRWFDPVTVSKIFILSPQEVYPTLEKYIEKKNIPKQYGGDLDFEFGSFPNLDDEAKELLADFDNTTPTGWVKGPIRWVNGDGPDARVVAVGSVDGAPRKTVLAVPRNLPVANVINGPNGIPPLNFADTPGTMGADMSAVKKGKGVTNGVTNGEAKLNGKKTNGALPDTTVHGQMEALVIS
ncbi:Patellin-3 [Arthrobotrys entomopaga]|nr:Patellin-3 [Arthrobotrys entomopaga]